MKDDLRADESALLDALRGAGVDVSRPRSMKCPWHEDRSPSAGVYLKDGVWRYKCQAATCGLNLDVFDVQAKVSGRSVEDVLRDYKRQAPTDHPPRPPATPAVSQPKQYESIDALKSSYSGKVTLYPYTNPDTGNIDLIKLRVERPGQKKFFVQAHLAEPGVDGVVVVSAPPKPWPLFNRKRLIDADTVIFVEGEKCVSALTAAGYVATCVSGGGGKNSAANTDLRPLAGKKVILWPDHDPKDSKTGERGGHEHMREVLAECQKQGVKVQPYWIDPEALGLGDKQDVADYLKRFDPEAHVDAIDAAIEDAEPLSKSARFKQYMEDGITGRRQAIPFPQMGKLSQLTKALQPGTTTLLCGEGGATKSMLMMQMYCEWTLAGVKAAVYMLEDDINMHTSRALGQRCGQEGFTDADWLRANGGSARTMLSQNESMTDLLLDGMDDAPNALLTYADILRWIKHRTDQGSRIVIIDPITAIDAGKESWRADLDFIIQAKSIARRAKASLIFVTHPRGGARADKPKLDDIAGGRGFPRFVQTVLWIRYANFRRRVESAYGATTNEQVDRLIHLLKVRNARGERMSVAFAFDKKAIRFRELGVDRGQPTDDGNEDAADNDIP